MTERIRRSFAAQGAMRLLGVSLEQAVPGAVTLSLPFRAEVAQQHGYFHGGVVGAMLDTACGYAALAGAAEGVEVVTVEYKVNFINPAQGAVLRATGRVIKPGRTLAVCLGEAEVDGKPCATALATMMFVRPPSG